MWRWVKTFVFRRSIPSSRPTLRSLRRICPDSRPTLFAVRTTPDPATIQTLLCLPWRPLLLTGNKEEKNDLSIFKASALYAFYKSKCPSVCLSVSPSLRLCVCSLLRYCLNFFFAPTSRSWISTIFRDSESLGKSNGKKWSQIWTFLVWKLSQIAAQKKVFFCWFCLTKHGANHVSRWIRDLWSKGILLILAYL